MNLEEDIRIIIVDDEPLARQGLVDMLEGKTGVSIIAQAANGLEAIDFIRTLKPDLIFLDIQMPGKTGIEVLQEIGAEEMPAVIFVTAFDQYAIKAFDLSAVDYLLKPYDQERFDAAFERAQKAVSLRDLHTLRSRLARLLEDHVPQSPSKKYLERIAVEMRGQVRVLPVDTIDYLSSSGSYVEIFTSTEKYLIRERMQTLEEHLDPDQFFRIHRSTIVKLDCIESILFNPGGNYHVHLRNGTRLKLGRSRREDLEHRLGLDLPGTSL